MYHSRGRRVTWGRFTWIQNVHDIGIFSVLRYKSLNFTRSSTARNAKFCMRVEFHMAFKKINLEKIKWPPNSKWRLLVVFFPLFLTSKVLFLWNFLFECKPPIQMSKGHPK